MHGQICRTSILFCKSILFSKLDVLFIPQVAAPADPVFAAVTRGALCVNRCYSIYWKDTTTTVRYSLEPFVPVSATVSTGRIYPNYNGQKMTVRKRSQETYRIVNYE